MPASPDDLFSYLADIGVPCATTHHEPVFTVEESRHLHETIPGAHTKNLFLWDRKDGWFLVTACEDTKVALGQLHRKIGAAGRLTFGSPEKMGELLGVAPGSVTPLALLNDTDGLVRFVLDAELARQPIVNCHPLVNTMTTSLAMDDFRSFLAAVHHEPLIVELSD